jgi:hypothetical protein
MKNAQSASTNHIEEPTSKLYSFRLEIDLMDQIRTKAINEKVSVTHLVRKYLHEGLNNGVSKPQNDSGLVTISARELINALAPNNNADTNGIQALQAQINALNQSVNQLASTIHANSPI